MTKKEDSTKDIEAEKQKTPVKKRSKKEKVSKIDQQSKGGVDEVEQKANLQGDKNPEIIDVSKDDILELERQTQDQKQTVYSQKATPNRANMTVLIAGGILSVAIGFGAAIGLYKYGVLISSSSPNEEQPDFSVNISEQKGLILELEKKLSNVQSKLELYILRTGNNNTSEKTELLGDEINRALTEIESVNLQVSKLSKRIDSLEQRPVLKAVPEDILEKHSKELQALQKTLTLQREQVQAVMQEAEEKETLAKQTAHEARIFSVVARLSSAIKNGDNYAEVLVDYEAASNLKAPDLLHKYAKTGFVTKEKLVEQFPIVARMALNSARSEGKEAQAKTFTNYLKTQLKARSVMPREGMSADAILSRAEAAVKDDKLADALSELESLDLAARTQMGDWISQAKERLAVVAYIDTIMAQIEK